MVRRLRWVKAQLMRKPGGREALARLLSAEVMPSGGWQVLDERTWLTGVTDPTMPWAERARRAGSVTAWRSLENRDERRWVWVQVIPLASTRDADEAFGGLADRMLSNLPAKVQVVSERSVEVDPPAGATKVWAHEQHTIGPAGEGLAFLLAGVVGAAIVVVCATDLTSSWDWPAVSDLFTRQVTRLPHHGVDP